MDLLLTAITIPLLLLPKPAWRNAVARGIMSRYGWNPAVRWFVTKGFAVLATTSAFGGPAIAKWLKSPCDTAGEFLQWRARRDVLEWQRGRPAGFSEKELKKGVGRIEK